MKASVTATLKTRCGCHRSMQVTFPPPPRILLPLIAPLTKGCDLQPPRFETREFLLVDQSGWPENGYAVYQEKA